MCSYKLIKHPQFYERSDYDHVFDHIIKMFKNRSEIKSIYTFGNINQPGISDIDILIIFNDGYQCNINPLEKLDERLKRLFTHGIMAINEKYIAKNSYFSNWSNIKHLYGQSINFQSEKPTIEEQRCLNQQLAIEYLTVNYIDLKIQKHNKTIKVRDLLQHVKGLSYDLDLLNINECNIKPFIDEIKIWINEWYINTPSEKTITKWFLDFEQNYETFYNEIILKYPIYLPKQKSYKISKRIEIIKDHKIKHIVEGITLPHTTSKLLGKYYLKIQNTLSSHTFKLPIENSPNNPILISRTNFYKELENNTTNNYPAFATLANSLIRSIKY